MNHVWGKRAAATLGLLAALTLTATVWAVEVAPISPLTSSNENAPISPLTSSNENAPVSPLAATDELTEEAVANPANSSGSVFRIGKEFVVAPGTKHTGNVLAFGSNVVVEGELVGHITAIGGTVLISGPVTQEVTVLGGRLILQSGADVEGTITAIGGGLERAEGVELHTDVNIVSLSQGLRVPRMRFFPFRPHTLFSYIVYLLGLFICVLLTGYFFPMQLGNVEKVLLQKTMRSVLVGIAALIVLLPLTAALIIVAAGLPLVFFYWLAMGWAGVLGYAAVARTVGQVLYTRVGLPARWPWLHVALGVLVLGVLRSIPFLGPVTGFVVLVLGMGAALRTHLGAVAS